MGMRRRIPLQFLMSQDRSQSQTRSSQGTSVFSESVSHSGSEVGEENSISEFGMFQYSLCNYITFILTIHNQQFA